MRIQPAQMDAILAHMTPKDVPEFPRVIDLFEYCGVFARDEAQEWRMRFSGWVDFLFGTQEDDEGTPLS